jgi:hypothetical protein
MRAPSRIKSAKYRVLSVGTAFIDTEWSSTRVRVPPQSERTPSMVGA